MVFPRLVRNRCPLTFLISIGSKKSPRHEYEIWASDFQPYFRPFRLKKRVGLLSFHSPPPIDIPFLYYCHFLRFWVTCFKVSRKAQIYIVILRKFKKEKNICVSIEAV